MWLSSLLLACFERPPSGSPQAPPPPADCEERDWYEDADGDGYGRAGAGPTRACDPGDGWSEEATDCDDGDAGVSPGGTEVCESRHQEPDEDCDGEVDEDGASNCEDIWMDGDQDSYGGELRCTCEPFGVGMARRGGDCDDENRHRIDACDPAEPTALPSASILIGRATRLHLRESDDGDPVLWVGASRVPLPFTGTAAVADVRDAWVEGLGLGAIGPVGVASGEGLILSEVDTWWDHPDDYCRTSFYLREGPFLGATGAGPEHFVGQTAYLSCVSDIYSALPGDLDGDGAPERLVGWWPEGMQAITEEGTLEPAIDAAAYVSSGGDLDGDGVDDVLIGGCIAPGPVQFPMTVADCPVVVEEASWLRAAGDLDGDGAGDLAAYWWNRVAVLSAPTTSVVLSEVTTGWLGDNQLLSLDLGSDADGDGLADLLFGVSGNFVANHDGAAALVFGPATGYRGVWDADVLWVGSAESDELGDDVVFLPGGWAVTSAGADVGGEDAGAIYLLDGWG